MLLHLEFLSFIILLVYLGALIILFLFVIMLLPTKALDTETKNHVFPSILLPGILFLNLLPPARTKFKNQPILTFINNADNLEQIGSLLYTSYSLLLILSALILFIAILITVSITINRQQ